MILICDNHIITNDVRELACVKRDLLQQMLRIQVKEAKFESQASKGGLKSFCSGVGAEGRWAWLGLE